jgi:hypothetical protein
MGGTDLNVVLVHRVQYIGYCISSVPRPSCRVRRWGGGRRSSQGPPVDLARARRWRQMGAKSYRLVRPEGMSILSTKLNGLRLIFESIRRSNRWTFDLISMRNFNAQKLSIGHGVEHSQ